MKDLKAELPSKALPISVGAVSEVGRREQNQDCMTGFSSPFGAVYLIADGMGGHRGGAQASRMVAEAFSRHLLAAPASSPPRDAITLAVRLANLEILEKSRSGNPDFAGMGSTVAIALVRKTGNALDLTTAHIGDSRIYLQRNGKLTLLTKDHTQVQMLLDAHTIDEATARNHPDASVLTRAMGQTTDLQVDISDPIPLCDGDGILLCTDGLSGFVSNEDIYTTIQQNPDPTSCANQLVQLALAAGSNDNITVQFLRIGQDGKMLSRRRSSKMQQDGKTQESDSQKTSILTSRVVPGLAILLLALAGIVAWLYYHHRAPETNSEVQQVGSRIDDLGRRANKASELAAGDKAGIEKDVQQVTAHDKSHGKSTQTAALLRDLNDLKAKFNNLVGDSYTLQSKKNEFTQSLDSIVKNGAAARQANAKLKDDIAKEEGNAKRTEDDLAKLEAKKKDLEAKIQEALKTGPRGGGPRSQPAPTHPANASASPATQQ